MIKLAPAKTNAHGKVSENPKQGLLKAASTSRSLLSKNPEEVMLVRQECAEDCLQSRV